MRKEKQYTRVSMLTKIAWTFLIVFVSINIAIWITGSIYVYKTLLYAYPDIDDLGIFETRIIDATQPKPWNNSVDFNKRKLPLAIREMLEKTKSVSFLVVRNDSVCYEEYWDSYYPNSLSNSFSMAKSIVSIAVGIAANEGKLNLDDAVGKYLPEFSKGENSKLTIRHLLMMASGLNWDESYTSLFSQTTEAYYGTNLQKLEQQLKVVEEPGKTFRYMSCNTLLLAMVVQKACGKNISNFVSEKIWNPIGAEHPAYWSLDHADGIEKSYCCFYADARDFARFGQLYLDSGMWHGHQIVSKDFVKICLTPNQLHDDKGNTVDFYGYHWWLMERNEHRIFYARGIQGQYIIVIPDLRIVAVRLGRERGEKLPNNHYSDMLAYVDGILEVWGKSTVH